MSKNWNWKKEDTEWNTGDVVEVVKPADLDELGAGGNIYLTSEVMGVIRKLCEDIKLEWQMLLCGEIIDGNAHVTGYWIPKQEVTGSTVKNLDLIDNEVIEEKKIIATIHSHSNMGVFFSSTDEVYTNASLIERHIVVNNNYDFTAITRWNMPNNKVTFLKARVIVKVLEVSEVEGLDNIDANNIGFYSPATNYTPPANNYAPHTGGYYEHESQHALTEDFTEDDFQQAMGGFYNGE